MLKRYFNAANRLKFSTGRCLWDNNNNGIKAIKEQIVSLPGRSSQRFTDISKLSKSDLSLLEAAYQKYEKVSFNSLESTYISSNISPLKSSVELENYLLNFKKDFSRFKNFNYLPLLFGMNQNIKSSSNTDFSHILDAHFSATPIKFSFAYGSSVFKQVNNDVNKKTQTDLIMGTTFPDHFHSLNLNKNPSHYSGLGKLGSQSVTRIGNYGPGVYFNPFVQVSDNMLIKYGVVSMEKLMDDLLNWNSMYLAGRLQKPVKIIKDDARIRFLNQENLRNAVGISLLLMSSNTKLVDLKNLFETITGLSYKGDIRTKIGGESPLKVKNIVAGQYDEFQELYKPIVDIFKMRQFVQFNDDSKFFISDDPIYKSFLLDNLPYTFKKRLFENYGSAFPEKNEYLVDLLASFPKYTANDCFKFDISAHSFTTAQIPKDIKNLDSETILVNDFFKSYKPNEFILHMANNSKLPLIINKTLEDIIMYPSIIQSVKGIFTAGIFKSINYALEKRRKYNNGKRNNN